MSRIHWPWWVGLALFVAVAHLGYRIYRGPQKLLAPTIDAITQVADRVDR